MSNTKFFNDAIAEAKAIRETALANAKLALEEAFTPRLKEMLATKLEEMDLDEEEEKMKEGMKVKDKSMEENLDEETKVGIIMIMEKVSETLKKGEKR